MLWSKLIHVSKGSPRSSAYMVLTMQYKHFHVFHEEWLQLPSQCWGMIENKDISFAWWRHQMETFPALLALCAENSWSPVNSPLKGQWRGALMFSLICARINGRVNNREASDLRRYRAHYDVIVMFPQIYAEQELIRLTKCNMWILQYCIFRDIMLKVYTYPFNNSNVGDNDRDGRHLFIALRPSKNWRHLANDIFQCILTEKISLKLVAKVSVDIKSSLV